MIDSLPTIISKEDLTTLHTKILVVHLQCKHVYIVLCESVTVVMETKQFYKKAGDQYNDNINNIYLYQQKRKEEYLL